MVSFKQDKDCMDAELFYYEFIENMTDNIPDNILSHLKQCNSCQSNIEDLKKELASTSTEQGEGNSAVLEALKLHFHYINKNVTCQTVKSFLPTLLHPSLQISIPTPITAHIDNCIQCRNDIEHIKSLALNDKQLKTLNLILSEKSSLDQNDCKNALLDIQCLSELDWNHISSNSSFKHCCICPSCRDMLFEKRQRILEQIEDSDQWPEFPCDAVQNEDLFDYCFPYDLNPLNDEYSTFRDALTEHLVTCKSCLEKMQKLHNTISEVATRENSNIVTTYTSSDTDESSDYAGYPIKIQKEIATPLKLSKKPRNIKINIQPFLKFTAAAAIVLVVSFFFLFNSPAKALTLDQMYKVIAGIKNVYISKYVAESEDPIQEKNVSISKYVSKSTEPIQEKMISKELAVILIKKKYESIYWDVKTATSRIKKDDNIIELELSVGELNQIKQKLQGSLGLLPFEFSDMPKNAIWDQETSKDELGLEYYSLIWSQKKIDGIILYKWQIQANPVNYYPQKCSLFRKTPENEDFKLINYIEIKYPKTEDIKKMLNEF